MVELKRIYWSRQTLRAAYSAVILWLGVSVVLALMPKSNPAGSRSAATVAEVLRGMVDGVLAAVTVPGLFVLVLVTVLSVHFYPGSKGGSTSLENFVAACARCNRTKGARVPSPGQQARMERRRREYVAPAGSVSVGARQPLS